MRRVADLRGSRDPRTLRIMAPGAGGGMLGGVVCRDEGGWGGGGLGYLASPVDLQLITPLLKAMCSEGFILMKINL